MILQRLEVEEGFLNGIDLRFRPGLNVLIGPRGAGKTSVIELIRFALGVPGYTDESDRTALEHARSVLETGEVTVTMAVGDSLVTAARTVDDLEPRASSAVALPIILSQNEIESVGLSAAGRLRLIDGFRSSRRQDESETELRSTIRSLSVELRSLSEEITGVEGQLEQLTQVQKELELAKKEHSAIAGALKKLAMDEQKFRRVTSDTTAAATKLDLLNRTQKQVAEWRGRLELILATSPTLEKWPDKSEADPLADVRVDVSAALMQVRAAQQRLDTALSEIDAKVKQARENAVKTDKAARDLRQGMEKSQKGAGDVAKKLSSLEKKLAQLTALKAVRAERVKKRDEISERRAKLLEKLDDVRDKRFIDRQLVAKKLNQRLGPKIRIDLEKSGLYSEYASAIQAALRGSGLHYNSLAPLLAARLSPAEFVEAIESDDVETIANVADLTPDRAMKLAAVMRSQNLADILTANLEDSVTLRLLDGAEYKTTEELSTGQRCTVLLPILLSHEQRTVIVDQPEDHLDNAFIVDTVIKALRLRRSGQIIFSTHNANIPVLGEAACVIVLGSDGQRGFARHSGALEDAASIAAITSIMEGGRDAFKRRADFYGVDGSQH